MANKKALITGITGQDGRYLTELLLSKGYEVFGMVRRASTTNTIHLNEFLNNKKLHLLYGDMTDSNSIHKILRIAKPDEVYNLAAQSHVRISFDNPEYTCDVTGLGVLRLLEAIRENNPKIRMYQSSSSEMMGKVQETVQKETTPFYPRSPYGCAKVFGYWITKNYRESYGMFACNGILYNHESPIRGELFVTRKITKSIAMIKKGELDCLYLGNLDSKRDWGHSKDYCRAMWMIMQQEKPDDFVIATGETHSVREFLEEALKVAGIRFVKKGKGLDEQYIDIDKNRPIVKVDKRFFRPAEVEVLLGNASKAKKVLGWKPEIKFKELVKEMMVFDSNQR